MNQISLVGSADALATIDFAVLDELRAMMPASDGDEDVVIELLQALLIDAPPRIAALRTAIAGRDAPAVLREAHGLKGGILSLGGLRAGAVCIVIEDAARAGDLDRAKTALPDLLRSFDQLCAALEEVTR